MRENPIPILHYTAQPLLQFALFLSHVVVFSPSTATPLCAESRTILLKKVQRRSHSAQGKTKCFRLVICPCFYVCLHLIGNIRTVKCNANKCSTRERQALVWNWKLYAFFISSSRGSALSFRANRARPCHPTPDYKRLFD